MHQRYGDAPRLCFHAIDPGTVDTKLMRHGSSWSCGHRKARAHIRKVVGMFPNVRTATASFEALTKDSFQEVSGTNLANSTREVYDAEKRARLWDDLVEM